MAAHHREHIRGFPLGAFTHVLIHVNTGNQAGICIYDVLDALSDYVWIHFTDEEAIFMNHPYPGTQEDGFLNAHEVPAVRRPQEAARRSEAGRRLAVGVPGEIDLL